MANELITRLTKSLIIKCTHYSFALVVFILISTTTKFYLFNKLTTYKRANLEIHNLKTDRTTERLTRTSEWMKFKWIKANGCESQRVVAVTYETAPCHPRARLSVIFLIKVIPFYRVHALGTPISVTCGAQLTVHILCTTPRHRPTKIHGPSRPASCPTRLYLPIHPSGRCFILSVAVYYNRLNCHSRQHLVIHFRFHSWCDHNF